jgi:hypothetical protein
MIKAQKFRITDRPYAVLLDSYRLDGGAGRGEIDAVWFRRRGGVLAACAGRLRDYQQPRQDTAEGFLKAYTDGRYGGDCKARWDGKTLWCLADEETRLGYREFLVPVLQEYPAIPRGWSGWWVFEKH